MQINNYKIFLASPGDTSDEREATEEVINEINKTIGSRNNFRIELLKWENNTYPSIGEDGQDVINKQIGLEYKIFIGIMWKKFGTPTKRAGSGTEEEFKIAYERFKSHGDINIMFYFNNAPIPQDSDLEQFLKVKEFKKKISDLGAYYWSYKSLNDFTKILREHLTSCILDLTSDSQTNLESEIPKSGPSENLIVPLIEGSFSKYLDDLEATFAHSRVDHLILEDIFIAPDLKDLNSSKKSSTYKARNLAEVSDAIDLNGIKFMLLGNESCGKTANLKYLFQKYFSLGLLPVLLKGTDINNNIRPDALVKLVEQKITEQYEPAFKLKDFEKKEFVLLIDDFHKASKGKNRYWPALMKNLESLFPNIILTGNSLMPLENLNKQDAFKNFDIYSILEFGPKFRQELVNKWNTLGLEERYIDKNELHRKNDMAIAHIKAVIGKNLVPSYPFFLLALLQSLESGNTQNSNYSIHGFYYELLINECFGKAVKDKKEISLYYNYLTHFCFHLFETEVKELSIEDFKGFHRLYCQRHDLSYSLESIFTTFDSAKLLYINGSVYVKEKYVYYFFVAKFIANNISKPEIRELVSKMSLRVFRDEYSSIIMFVTHLSKEEFIINELISNANSIFPDTPICKLQEDIQGINLLIDSIPEQVMELVDVKDKRNEALEDEEETERLEKEFEEEASNYDDFKLDDDTGGIDFYAKITLALKTIDILGQVAKKHWGEIDGDQKFQLVSATYNLGLRTLSFYLQMLQKNSKDLVQHIEELVDKKHIKDRFSLQQSIEETAKNFIFKLCFLSSFGITKRVSNSIGYDKLKNTFERALDSEPFNSVKLIDLAIKLGYSSISTQFKEIEEYEKEMNKNKLSFMILQNLAIDYIYMFDTDYKTRSRICNTLKISIQEQLKIDSTSTVKKK